ncbi:hypothetical protein JYT74_01540 [Crocinitomix catalasitica]|nr:hypothetical protein [Crocinitomix catalasitica]
MGILIPALFLSAIFFQTNCFGQEVIKLIYAETVKDGGDLKETTTAVGNVQFQHKTTRLFCDSALLFRKKNIVHAYGRVQINQGDTINVFGDSLKYYGKTNLSKMMGNVRFRDNEYKLLTDSLDYDGNLSKGTYKNHAVITSIHQDLKLTSVKGYYFSKTKTFFFKDSVHAEHPNYELFSDTLEFRTIGSSAHFHGPTVIYLDSSKSTVYCKKGIYFTEEDKIQLWNGATIVDSARTLYADSLIFDQKTGVGEGFCNVDMYDSTENMRFKADYMHKLPDNEEVILKDNAMVIQYSNSDTLYLMADTIRHRQDTLTDLKVSIAENNVDIINGDLSIHCDSAYFSESDSIMKLHKHPIMWNGMTQMTADSILADYYDKEFHKMYMYYNSMIITEHDSLHYDQIKGKFMVATLDSNKIQDVFIEQNTQTLYYVVKEEKDTAEVVTKTLDGMNKIDCSEIIIDFEKSEINRISFLDQPTSIFYPMDRIPAKEKFLKGFLWEIGLKPEAVYIE